MRIKVIEIHMGIYIFYQFFSSFPSSALIPSSVTHNGTRHSKKLYKISSPESLFSMVACIFLFLVPFTNNGSLFRISRSGIAFVSRWTAIYNSQLLLPYFLLELLLFLLHSRWLLRVSSNLDKGTQLATPSNGLEVIAYWVWSEVLRFWLQIAGLFGLLPSNMVFTLLQTAIPSLLICCPARKKVGQTHNTKPH